MSKIKIIFISGMTTDTSTGEYSQLKSFIEDLNDDFINKIYLRKTSYFQFNSQNTEFYENEEQLNSYIEEFNPELIVLSEYQHMTPVFLNYINSKNITVATIDHSGLSRHVYTLIPKTTIFLKPCPLSNPSDNTKYDKYWSLHRKFDTDYSRNDINDKFGIKDSSKIVFMSVAPWQYETSVIMGKNKFYDYLINLLFNCLLKTNKYITLFFISPIKHLNKIAVTNRDKLKVLFFNSLNNVDYNGILFNSDLVISDNITQVSLSKSFIKGTNVLSLINTLNVNLEFMKCFKFNTFPYDYDFLNYLYRLEYAQLITKAEVFNFNDISLKINFLLENKLNSHVDYSRRCKNLLSPAETIKEIIKEKG